MHSKKVSNALENIIVAYSIQNKIHINFLLKYHSYVANFDSCDIKFVAVILIFAGSVLQLQIHIISSYLNYK